MLDRSFQRASVLSVLKPLQPLQNTATNGLDCCSPLGGRQTCVSPGTRGTRGTSSRHFWSAKCKVWKQKGKMNSSKALSKMVCDLRAPQCVTAVHGGLRSAHEKWSPASCLCNHFGCWRRLAETSRNVWFLGPFGWTHFEMRKKLARRSQTAFELHLLLVCKRMVSILRRLPAHAQRLQVLS